MGVWWGTIRRWETSSEADPHTRGSRPSTCTSCRTAMAATKRKRGFRCIFWLCPLRQNTCFIASNQCHIIGHLLQVDLFAFGSEKFINVDDPPAHLDFSIGRYGVDHPVDGHLLNHLLFLLLLFVFYRFLVFLLFLFFFFLWRLSLIWWNKEVILALFTVAVLNGDVLLQFQKLKQLVVVVGRLKIFEVL
ncbi:hypothetical protein TYRP_009752 [Tyrophagus putrescentiae]|nr:hypothetical protein TYRP_009752 [Tyrophagus putrescentiae]